METLYETAINCRKDRDALRTANADLQGQVERLTQERDGARGLLKERIEEQEALSGYRRLDALDEANARAKAAESALAARAKAAEDLLRILENVSASLKDTLVLSTRNLAVLRMGALAKDCDEVLEKYSTLRPIKNTDVVCSCAARLPATPDPATPTERGSE